MTQAWVGQGTIAASKQWTKGERTEYEEKNCPKDSPKAVTKPKN